MSRIIKNRRTVNAIATATNDNKFTITIRVPFACDEVSLKKFALYVQTPSNFTWSTDVMYKLDTNLINDDSATLHVFIPTIIIDPLAGTNATHSFNETPDSTYTCKQNVNGDFTFTILNSAGNPPTGITTLGKLAMGLTLEFVEYAKIK